MKIKITKGYIILAILLVVFTLIAFLVPTVDPTVFWIAYLFGLAAIVSQVYFFKVSFSGKGNAKSRFYGIPIAKIGTVYLVIQIILSFLEMGFSSVFPMWLALFLNVLVIAAAFIGCIATEIMRDEIENQDVKNQESVSAMRELQSLANAAAVQCDGEEMKQILRKVSEELRYSDPVSSVGTAPLEKEMLGQLEGIQEAVIDKDTEAVRLLSDKLLSTLTERNRICKLNK